jgi:hypothetical protein
LRGSKPEAGVPGGFDVTARAGRKRDRARQTRIDFTWDLQGKDSNWLEGGKIYRLRVPANVSVVQAIRNSGR